jgi:hypothetical protein
MAAVYANSSNQVASLKELYIDSSDYLQDLVYKKNPLLALLPKNESIDGAEGKYIPVPLEYGAPQGRSHTFASAQSNQTAVSMVSFFVSTIEDYQIVTITNKLMKQTATNAGAFIDAAKNQIDGGIRNITNNLAFELFSNGYGSRGRIGAFSNTGAALTITLTNVQQVVNFEVGMTLRASLTDGGAISSDTAQVTSVNRQSGVILATCSDSSPDSNWAVNSYMSVDGDVPSAGISNISQALCLSGLSAWIPASSPSPSENFWNVDRSSDPTRLAGLRYDASSQTIEEGITNALAFLSREGGSPDIAVMDFASYAALVNALGAKVQYVTLQHDECEVAFQAIRFQSAYGVVSVLADRSCPPQTAFLLQMDTWKLRSMGKVPAILTYGMEGLDGLRVGNADALEVRVGHYSNLICSAPGWNCRVSLSA